MRFKLIRLGWRRSAVARAATIARGGPKISVMNFHAPHDQTRDQKTREAFLASVAAFVESLPAAWRASIFWIDDGDADVCNIEFRAGLGTPGKL